MVTWRDAVFNQEFETAEEAWPWFECITVGFVLRHDEDGIAIGMTANNNENDKARLRQVQSIPAAYIVSITELQEKDA